MIRQTNFVSPPTPLGYLKQRVHEEAVAAVQASSVEATLIHVALATAYAKRFGEGSATARQEAHDWVDDHRAW